MLSPSTCNTPQHTLQNTAIHCNTLQHTATHCIQRVCICWRYGEFARNAMEPLGHSKVDWLQHTPRRCITPQHAATHCNTHTPSMMIPTIQPIAFLSVISWFSNLNRWSSCLDLFGHVPLKRDQWDWDWKLRLSDSPNAIGCTTLFEQYLLFWGGYDE